jgi:hypothetical protein
MHMNRNAFIYWNTYKTSIFLCYITDKIIKISCYTL